MNRNKMLLLSAAVFAAGLVQGGELTRLVDPFWGCGAVRNPESQGMARGWNWLKAQVGNTHPGAVMPFGWVSACAYSGNYSSGYGRWGNSSGGAPRLVDERLRAYGFTHFHNSGVGYIGKFYNYFLFTPSAEGAETARASLVTDERADPGYYAATLADYGASFELAARPYAMCHRYRFPSGRGRVRIDLRQAGLRPEAMGPKSKYRETVESADARETSAGTWEGTVRIYGLDFHFAVRAKGRLGAATCRDGVIEIPFEGESAETVIGFSFANVAEAAARAGEAESAGFERSRAEATDAWERALGRVRATFADERVRRRFASALYHSLVKPVDCGTGFLDYSTMWDVYKTQLPLVLSTQPQVARRMMDDMLKVSAELGFFPLTQMMTKGKGRDNGQAAALSTYTLADAFFRGVLTAADYPRLKTAFAGQLDGTTTEGKSPTYALDLAGACRAAAFVAEACGDAAYSETLRRRASVWREVYDPKTGYLVEDAKYYEGNFRNYSFRPHVGMADRIALAGGREKFAAMLDGFFRVGYVAEDWDPAKERVPRVGFFEGLNNESDMETPYTYVWAGRPDRMAEVLDAIRRYRFTDGEGGCPGNNDSGGTSAWYVWSCLGLYPLTGAPYYLLATPSVDAAEIAFARGTLRIAVERESAASVHPAGFTLDGRAFREPWIAVDRLERGGTLVFRLADRPSAEPFPVPTWLD